MVQLPSGRRGPQDFTLRAVEEEAALCAARIQGPGSSYRCESARQSRRCSSRDLTASTGDAGHECRHAARIFRIDFSE